MARMAAASERAAKYVYWPMATKKSTRNISSCYSALFPWHLVTFSRYIGIVAFDPHLITAHSGWHAPVRREGREQIVTSTTPGEDSWRATQLHFEKLRIAKRHLLARSNGGPWF